MATNNKISFGSKGNNIIVWILFLHLIGKVSIRKDWISVKYSSKYPSMLALPNVIIKNPLISKGLTSSCILLNKLTGELLGKVSSDKLNYSVK